MLSYVTLMLGYVDDVVKSCLKSDMREIYEY